MSAGAGPLLLQCRRSALHPSMRALRPAPRPTFSRRESRQRYARAAPLDPLRGTLRSPCGARTPSIGLVPPTQTELPL